MPFSHLIVLWALELGPVWLMDEFLHNFQVLVSCGELQQLQCCPQSSGCAWSCIAGGLFFFTRNCRCSQAGSAVISGCEKYASCNSSSMLCSFKMVGSFYLQKLSLSRLQPCLCVRWIDASAHCLLFSIYKNNVITIWYTERMSPNMVKYKFVQL